jgi:uncharacterized protein (UPF0276 family)
MSPLSAGLGFKPAHFEAALAAHRPGLWFEVHPENYLAAGGPRKRMLEQLAAAHPVSLHGVSMSLAGAEPPDALHLRGFAALVKGLQPTLVSEHLAWSRMGSRYEPDLLPFVRDQAALLRISAHVQQVQEAIARPLALENPAHYFALAGHSWDELDFLHELVRRTGCRLLVDVSNVHLSAHNLGYSAQDWLDRVQGDAVAELHLAGYSTDPVLGEALWIDSHDTPVQASTWALYERLLARIGPRPTLIEWDGRLPPFERLWAEAQRAEALLQGLGRVTA